MQLCTAVDWGKPMCWTPLLHKSGNSCTAAKRQAQFHSNEKLSLLSLRPTKNAGRSQATPPFLAKMWDVPGDPLPQVPHLDVSPDAYWDCGLPECALVCNTTVGSSSAPLQEDLFQDVKNWFCCSVFPPTSCFLLLLHPFHFHSSHVETAVLW